MHPKPGQRAKRDFECAGPIGSAMKSVLGNPTFQLRLNLVEIHGLASQPIRASQNNQVLVPVQFPDYFVIARARRIQVGDAAKVSKAGFNAARVIPTPVDFRPRVNNRSENWKLVSLDLVGEVDQLLRALPSGDALGHRQMGVETGVQAAPRR